LAKTARINEENLLKELPNYHDRKHLIFSWYKYQYALLCCNLGNTYNELALMRDAKNNYNSSKKYSLQAVDMFRKINKLNSYYFSIFGTTYSNLAITYRGLANLSKESSLLQLSLNYAKKSLLIFEEVKDCYNIARIQNSIGNIYNDLINYKNNANKKETFYSNSESYLNKSLEFYNIEKYPFEFARSHMNIGSLNLLMMCNCNNQDKIYSYYIKAEKNFEMCKEVFIKGRYENEYIALHYNLLSLYFQFMKRVGDVNQLSKIINSGDIILEVCTVESKPNIYMSTNHILADAYKFVIESCEFIVEEQKIDLFEEAISKYEIVLGFKELNIEKKATMIVDLTRLNMTLLDMTNLRIYEEKCKYYCIELNNIIAKNPEISNLIEEYLLNQLN
jgi:tetratricopeptide (TPR) repeat protein